MNSVSPQLSESADLAVRLVLGLLVLSVLVLIVYQAISFFAGEKGRKLGSRKFWMAAGNLIILLTLLVVKGAVEGLLQYVGNVIGLLLPFLEPGWPAVILVGLFYTCLATLSLVFFVQLTGAFYWWSKELVEALIRKIELIQKLQIPSLQVHIFRGLRFLIDGFRFVMIAIGLLVFFPLVFRFFPRTASFIKSIEEALGTPAREIGIEILEYIPNLGYLLIILALGWVILRLMRYLFESVQAETLALPGFDPEWAMPTYKVGRAMLLLFLLMVGFPYLPGSGSRFFQGFSLFVGALLTLGGASAIGNILSGVILTYTGGFRLGDRVSIGETTGKVVQKSLLVTRVQTNRNITVTIPNTTVVSSPVLNYTKEARNGLVLTVTAGIGYEVDWRDVHKLMIDAAHQTEHILPDPAPCVWQESLDDYAVKYQLRASTNQPDGMDETHSNLRRNVLDSFNRAGVEIMTPSVLAHRDASPLAVPPNQGRELSKPPGLSDAKTEQPE